MARSPLPLPTRMPRTKGQWAMALLAVVVALAFWWWQERGGAPSTADREPDRPAASATVAPQGGADGASTDPATGLPVVEVEDLPAEAVETLELIEDGGPFPYDRDGVTFENREGILPDREPGYYEEYTVPTPGEDDRGARPIVTGDGDEYLWTPDHYESFAVIAR